MSKHSDEIRNKYIKNPPEGMTADDIRHMSEDDLYTSDLIAPVMNKSSHTKQFLLPCCECYCNAAPIPFVGYTSIPLSRPR